MVHTVNLSISAYCGLFYTNQPLEKVNDEEMNFSPETVDWVDALVEDEPPPNIVYDRIPNVNTPPPFWGNMFNLLSAQTPSRNNQYEDRKVIATGNFAR